jgi:serine/threonine-protein kinase
MYSRLGSGLIASPDGRAIAYTTGQEGEPQSLVVRPLDRLQETVLAKGEGVVGPYHPFFSPDNAWLGFVTRTDLKKISVTGGAPITIASVDRSRGASWGPDGTIVFAPSVFSGLMRVPSTGGAVEPVTTLDKAKDERTHRWPQWLPDGRHVLFSGLSGDSSSFDVGVIEAVNVATGARKVVHRGGYYARYVPTGHLLFVHRGTLFALPFDLGRLEATGAQMPVLEGLEANPNEGSAQFGVSDSGLLVYLDDVVEVAPFTVVSVDRSGRSQPLLREPGIYGTPRLSPDGRRLAVCLQRDENWDVWVYDIGREVATRVTFGEQYDADPVWSPDGAWIAYEGEVNGKDGIFKKRADGTGEAIALVAPGKLTFPAPQSFSPDGKQLLLQSAGESGRTDLYVVPADGQGEPAAFLKTSYSESSAHFSPDGRFVAYESDETGKLEVFVTTFPAGGGKWQISAGGGAQPIWSRDRRELFFRTAEGVMSVRIDASGGGFRASRPEQLFKGAFLGGLRGILLPGFNFPDYDAAADGKRFVMFEGGQSRRPTTRAKVVLGWFQELERLTGGGR